MFCFLYLFLIVLCGLLHKTIQKKYLLGFNEILMVNGEEDYSILITYRNTLLIEISIYKFLYQLGIYDLYVCLYVHRIFYLVLNICRQRVVKLIKFCTSYHSSHVANVMHLLHFTKQMPKKFTKERKISDAKPIIFLEGVQFTVCPIIMIPKEIPSYG